MPRGQYERKPRAIVLAPAPAILPPGPPTISPDGEVRPAPPTTDLDRPGLVMGGAVIAQPTVTNAPPLYETLERMTIEPVPVAPASVPLMPPPPPPKDDFEDWVDGEDAGSAAMPVSQPEVPSEMTRLIGGWGREVCRLHHNITWLPTRNGRAIEVTLITDHGTTVMEKPVTGWTEVEVSEALERMRVEDLDPPPAPPISPDGF